MQANFHHGLPEHTARHESTGALEQLSTGGYSYRMMITRRTLLSTVGGAAQASVVAPRLAAAGQAETLPAGQAKTPPAAPAQTPPAGPDTLPALPYPVAALEPHIDAQTMTIHH